MPVCLRDICNASLNTAPIRASNRMRVEELAAKSKSRRNRRLL